MEVEPLVETEDICKEADGENRKEKSIFRLLESEVPVGLRLLQVERPSRRLVMVVGSW